MLTPTQPPAFLNSTCIAPLNQIKPYLGYFSVDALRTIFNSNYNSMQVKVTKRLKGKTYIDANYTWSRDLGNSQADYSAGLSTEHLQHQVDYGRATEDRNQVLSIDGVLEEPWFHEQKGLVGRALGGWEISGIYTANSGLPLTATASGFSLGQYNLPSGLTSVYNNRQQHRLCDRQCRCQRAGQYDCRPATGHDWQPQCRQQRQVHNKGYHQLWFYTGAFASPNPSTNTSMPGNEQRGTIQGPGFGKVDFGVYRNFRIGERLNFQFRAEAFNATNHTNVQNRNRAEGTLLAR